MDIKQKGQFQIGNQIYTAAAIRSIFDSLADENSGRTEDGVMHINWVKHKLRKWEITMPPMTSAQMTTLLAAIQGQRYQITIWDVMSNNWRTCWVYTSNSAADIYSGVLVTPMSQNNNDVGLWRGFKFSAIETGETIE